MIEENGILFTSVVTDMVELKKCSRSPQSYKNHVHQELSVGIIREGSTTVNFPGETIEFMEGDGVIIPPSLSHMCSPDDVEHWRFDMLYINPTFYGDALIFKKAVKIPDAFLIEEFLTLLNEVQNQRYIEGSLIELLENLSEDDYTSAAHEETVGDNLRIYIEDHWLDKISLNELEQHFNINRFALIRIFRKTYNTTPIAYQLQLKMAEAKKLLMQHKSILDVSYELGFFDQAHFTREFKKMNGLTPSVYQESIES